MLESLMSERRTATPVETARPAGAGTADGIAAGTAAGMAAGAAGPAPLTPRRRPRYRRWLFPALGVLGVAVAIFLVWRPEPVTVEVEPATAGPLEVTVDEDGRTRVQDRYMISAPLAGTLARLEIHAGDSVRRGDIVARVLPLAAPLLDPRSRAEAAARVTAAGAAVRQAATVVARARAAHEIARRDAERQRVLLREGATPAQAVEQAELAERTQSEETASAEFGLRVAESELRVAQAALLRFESGGTTPADVFEIHSPVNGRVLRVLQESEGAVQSGTPLIEIGDPGALEVVVDVLTADAVDIRPGAPVRLERWGGDSALSGHVHRVEPSAFTRLSSLGIEEQRVNVVIDLDGPRDRWASLGDGYRVEARIVVWRADSVLQMPAGAVFQSGTGWAVYVVEHGRARLRRVDVGRRNPARVEVRRGLRTGEMVIVYPGDDITDRVSVEAR